MTTDQASEIIEYFRTKELPNTFSYPGGTIANCKTFVDAQIHRLTGCVPLVQQCSYDLLKMFRQGLEKL